MENYTITKEQVLELSEINKTVKYYLQKEFPDAFKKELEVGVWYKGAANVEFLICYQGNEKDNYGFWEGQPYRNDLSFGDYWNDESILATPEEVKQALENEVIKRFGKDWQNAEIEKCLVHGDPHSNCITVITTNTIWNKNGCIYYNGVFAEPLKSKIISIDKAVKILSKKYGKQVEIK